MEGSHRYNQTLGVYGRLSPPGLKYSYTPTHTIKNTWKNQFISCSFSVHKLYPACDRLVIINLRGKLIYTIVFRFIQ